MLLGLLVPNAQVPRELYAIQVGQVRSNFKHIQENFNIMEPFINTRLNKKKIPLKHQ